MKASMLEFLEGTNSSPTQPQEAIEDFLNELKATVVTEQLLRATKIGVVVNKLRKSTRANRQTKRSAKTLLETWKELVISQKAAVVATKSTILTPTKVSKISTKGRRSDGTPSSGVKRHRTLDLSDFGIIRTKPAPLPSLVDLCVQQLRENLNNIGQWRGLQLSDDLLHKIFRHCPGDQLWKICSLNPQWIKRLETIWQKICEKEVMDKSLKKETTWFALFESWKKAESEKRKRCQLMKQRHDLKRRKETRHITSTVGMRKFKENGRKRRRKAQVVPSSGRIRQAKPILRGVPSMEEWRQNNKFRKIQEKKKARTMRR